MMFELSEFISEPSQLLSPFLKEKAPWEVVNELEKILESLLPKLSSEYTVKGNVAIHTTANIEPNAVIKGPVIIGPKCFVASFTYLRAGVFLDEGSIVGPYSELKTSILGARSSLSHLSYVGNSFIGAHVNIEAGAMIANHFNERENKEIILKVGDEEIKTGIEKFGALIGDNTKIGANAVLSPGTVLKKNAIVKRLELI